MKVLMFGWEFPPHISGGLGTACYGLTKGLAAYKDVDVTFVVPKAYGDEDESKMTLIGANKTPLKQKKISFGSEERSIDYYTIDSHVVPYTDPDEFWKLKNMQVSQKTTFVETREDGTIDFSGKYGANLIEEIFKYSIVAKSIAEQQEFDVIHAHDWLAYPAGIEAKNTSGKPLIVHVHATDFDRSGGSVNPKVYAIEREGMEAADQIITVSNLTKRIVIEKYGIPEEKITTIYNAVEPIESDEKEALKKGVKEKVVTFLGRITMQKGPEYFVEAAYKVLQKASNVRFVMAGNGDMMNAMIKRAAQLGITDKFHFTGFLKGDDVFHMLRMSDVYVMPSVSEPFGISPLEAMQADVPVIISKQSGVAEILTHAIKVDFWDINAMADAIYGIVSYPAMQKMFYKHARIEVDNLQWKKSAEHVRALYLKTINQKDSYTPELITETSKNSENI